VSEKSKLYHPHLESNMPVVVDLFCGVGGLTHGFILEGFDVAAGIDVDESCRFAYEANNAGAKFISQSVRDLTPDYLRSLYIHIPYAEPDDIKILVGCAPCQPFSLYANRPTVDVKWDLLYTFGKLVTAVRPQIVSMENVEELRKYAVFKAFRRTLEDAGYHIWEDIVECVDYGIPQTRSRLVLLASSLGEISLIDRTHCPDQYVTVRDAIAHLEIIAAGEVSANDPLHRASLLSDLNLERIRATPEGGGWSSWPERLISPCHTRESGKSYGSVYGRMSWDKPAPTMTTQCNGYGNGRFGHPDQDRAISLREAAIFQTFPDNYRFVPPDTQICLSDVAMHIGNAVPVRLGQTIAQSIRRHLDQHHE
jgi:DNA (cytosine-5)-methyltransferase 1